MKKIKGIIALSRFVEVFDFTIALTLIATLLSSGWLGLRIIVILFANFFAMTYAFMINDIEDAKEDSEDAKKKLRNPLCNGSLNRKEAIIVANITMLISLILFLIVSYITNLWTVFIIGIITLIVSFLYSWRKVRLKAIPVVDVISHMFMLSGSIYLTTYYSFSNNLTTIPLLVFLGMVFISGYGQLDNEIRDYETDKKTKVKTIATIIGFSNAKLLRTLLMATAVIFLFIVGFSITNIFSLITKFIISFLILLLIPIVKLLNKEKGFNLKVWIHRSIIYATIIAAIWLFLSDKFLMF